jgi:hypothetical protein
MRDTKESSLQVMPDQRHKGEFFTGNAGGETQRIVIYR